MKLRFSSLAILIALFTLTASAAWAGKAKVCHVPPGNPANFHTISVSQNAVQAHLNHGDLAGACSSNCDVLCSEENPCTTGECSCPCFGGVPGYREALNGDFGLTGCQEAVNPGIFEFVQLNTGDGRAVQAQTGFSNACDLTGGSVLFLSPEESAACVAQIRRKIAAEGFTCTGF